MHRMLELIQECDRRGQMILSIGRDVDRMTEHQKKLVEELNKANETCRKWVDTFTKIQTDLENVCERFAIKMKECEAIEDREKAHAEADDLMYKILKGDGYNFYALIFRIASWLNPFYLFSKAWSTGGEIEESSL